MLVVCTRDDAAGPGRAPARRRTRPPGAAVRAGADLHGAAAGPAAPLRDRQSRPICSSSGIGRWWARPSPRRCPKRRARATSRSSTACSPAARRTRANGAKYEVQTAPGGPASERFLDFVYQPIKDARGAVTGIFVLGADVTLRTQAYHALRESEARFRSALKAGRMGSWETDLATRTRTWSQEGMALFGLDLPDGRGQRRRPRRRVRGRAASRTTATWRAHFHALAERQDSFAAEYRIVRPDGTTLWLSGRGLVTARGRRRQAAAARQHHGRRHRAQARRRELRVERERLRLALSAGQMGAFELDIVDDVLWWSPADLRAVRRRARDLHADARERPRPGPPGRPRGVRQAAAPRRIAQRRAVRRTSSASCGPTAAASGSATAARPSTTPTAGRCAPSASSMDITERKHAEQVAARRRPREGRLHRDARRTSCATRSRRSATPSSVLRQHRPPSDPRVAWCHDVIERQIAQMARLLDDLLDVSRLTRGAARAAPRAARRSPTVDRARDRDRPAADRRSRPRAARRPARRDAAPRRRPDAAGAGLLERADQRREVHAGQRLDRRGRPREGDEIAVRVKDTGIGIAEEHLGRIFEMFGQVELHAEAITTRRQAARSACRRRARLLRWSLRADRSCAAEAGEGRWRRSMLRLPQAHAVGAATKKSSDALVANCSGSACAVLGLSTSVPRATAV